mmetsp:Transcript_20992/g.45779  ORF Transcript_20992/g.45779 Transcript_20992/m.45779 type:complete len:200 (+) Transcript_20992:304-903(+)
MEAKLMPMPMTSTLPPLHHLPLFSSNSNISNIQTMIIRNTPKCHHTVTVPTPTATIRPRMPRYPRSLRRKSSIFLPTMPPSSGIIDSRQDPIRPLPLFISVPAMLLLLLVMLVEVATTRAVLPDCFGGVPSFPLTVHRQMASGYWCQSEDGPDGLGRSYSRVSLPAPVPRTSLLLAALLPVTVALATVRRYHRTARRSR